MVHFRRKDRDIFRAIGEMMRVLVEIIKHRARGYTGGENKYESMPPEPPEKILVGKNQDREKENEDEWCQTKRDIGMKTETEEKSSEKERNNFPGTETTEEKIEGKGEEEGCHDGSESDAREIDRPVGGGSDECRDDPGETTFEKLPSEESDTERGEGAENSRPELECGDIVAECLQCESLEIDEEPFSSGVVFVEEFIISGFVGFDRISAVHRLVGVESGGEILYIIEAEKKSENDDRSETKEHRGDAACIHSMEYLFFFSCVKIITCLRIEKNRKDAYE